MTAPNVIAILADDLGFADLGCFGGEIATPNLDRLAARGVRMSSFYVTPRCSPSRAALLTGQHPHATGVGILTSDDRPRGYRGALSTEVPTLAERLKELGYTTALAGKWHLSSDVDTPNETWPTRRGFDEFYGFLPGCGNYYQPRLRRGEELVPEEEFSGADYYFTDDVSAFAADFVTRSAERSEPFFLYFAQSAPHWPLHAREADIARYRERFAAGWDEIRAARYTRQRELGFELTQELPPRDSAAAAWRDVEHPGWEAERMAVYAAQVEAMDRGIGRVLDAVDASGIADDTVVMFFSDNGACEEHLPDSPNWSLPEVLCPRYTRDGRRVRVGNTPSVMPGPEDTYASYGRAWSNVSNTPFRLHKRWVHEGGISSAFIASWPAGGISGGRLITDLGHIIDITPSILDAAGATSDTPGTSLLPAWRGDGADREERTLCWEHIGNAAVRRGRWKLVREALQPWELYDVVADRGETRNLIAENTRLAADLEREWETWAAANGVIPWESVLADYATRGRTGAANG
jgi:arylsulfatase A-like enzyme